MEQLDPAIVGDVALRLISELRQRYPS